jgi:hypothetical protein
MTLKTKEKKMLMSTSIAVIHFSFCLEDMSYQNSAFKLMSFSFDGMPIE